MYRLARVYLRRRRPYQSLQPTALINELYLRSLDKARPVQLENRAHLFGIFEIAARLMLIVRVDQPHAHHAARRRSAAAAMALEDCMAAVLDPAADVLELDQSSRPVGGGG